MTVLSCLTSVSAGWTQIHESFPSTVLPSNLVLLLKERKIRERKVVEIDRSSGTLLDGWTDRQIRYQSHDLRLRLISEIRLDGAWTTWTSIRSEQRDFRKSGSEPVSPGGAS